MKTLLYTVLLLLIAYISKAQDAADTIKPKKKLDINIGSKKENKNKGITFHYGMMDIGTMFIDDRTNYGNNNTQSFLTATSIAAGKDRMAINQNKTINFNFHLITGKVALVKKKAYFNMGLALQYYETRYRNNSTYVDKYYAVSTTGNNNAIIRDSLKFTKNKLSQANLMMPATLLVKVKLDKKHKLVLGGGVYGAYNFKNHQKQISAELGKEKIKLYEGFTKMHYGINAEVGIDDMFRIYITKSMTPIHTYGLSQYPMCIGIRFSGL